MSRPDDDTGGFLARWAKRKQDVQLEAQRAAEPAAPSADVAPVAEPELELPLPSLDDVLPGGDLTAFMQRHVPDALRNAALRKMWAADPEISSFIEMADYQWDFNNPDSIPGWSSSLEGVDVEKLVARIFNGAPPAAEKEPELICEDEVAPAAETSPNPEQISEFPDKSLISNETLAGDTPSTPSKGAGDAYVAVQNNDTESTVYQPPRKRNGGALPS
jgi:hypothetical protein